MADGYRHDFTEELEAVARGLRRLEDISDPALRDAVRAALGLRARAPGLDGARRARMRRAVVAAAPSGPRLSDRFYAGAVLLATPAPYAVRSLAVLAIAGAIVAGAAVSSADALPDDALYPLKAGAETLRLSLASAPEDRAAVELSLAEYRLSEAERLAEAGHESGTLVAAAAYGSHLANAAAELAQLETLTERGASLVAQLEARLAEQQQRAAATARRLLESHETQLAAVVLAAIVAPREGTADSVSARIAENAASVAQHLADVAAQRADGGQPLVDALPDVQRSFEDESGDDSDPDLAGSPAVPAVRRAAPIRGPAQPARTAAAQRPAVGSVAIASAKPTPTRRPGTAPRTTVDPSARIAAEKAKQAASAARYAAQKAQEAAKRTAKPTPTRRPAPTPTRAP